jgi:ketosteroid isomerase-like protein
LVIEQNVKVDGGQRPPRRSVPTMSEGHPNAIAYRRTADAFRSGDQTELASLIASDVVWHVPGAHSMAGDIRGRDQLVEWLRRLRAKGFWLTEHDVFANDEHVCALSVMGAQRGGVAVQTRVVSTFHYREGQQLERWFYPDDLAAWDQIFAE